MFLGFAHARHSVWSRVTFHTSIIDFRILEDIIQPLKLLTLSLAAGLLCPTAWTTASAVERGANLLLNNGFENEGGWTAVGDGFKIDCQVAHGGRQSMRCEGATLESTHGACQVITLDPPVKHPFRISAWSRTKNAEVGQDYDIYLDVFYADGTPLWGQTASFQPGTHDWQKSEFSFEVPKPVKRIEVFVLFRKAKGTVWFDDLDVSLAPFTFTQMRVLPDLFGAGTLTVLGNASQPAQWRATLEGPGLRLEASGERLPIRCIWTNAVLPATASPSQSRLRVSATDSLLGQTITLEQPVTLQAAGKRETYVLWTESSMRRVMPQALPDRIPLESSFRLALAGGEYENFQVVLLGAPGQRLNGVRVEIMDLVCSTNQNRIAAENIQWHQVGYVKVDKPNRHPAVPDAVGGWWPDPLLPVRQFDVPPGFTQPIWITVHAPPTTPAGVYSGSLTVRVDGQEAKRVDVVAEVYRFDLPRESHLKTAFALMDGFLERVYGAPLRPEQRQRYGDFVLEHRLNPDDISRTAPPALEDLRHYRDRGLNAFNVLNLVEERGQRPWVCFSELPTYTPQFKAQLTNRLDPYMAALRKENLLPKAYVYTFDERGKEFFPIIREYFGLMKQRYPGIHTLTTAYVPQNPKAMRELNVDWNCPVTSVYRLADADRCRAAGFQVWSYLCCGPRYPYANWMADDPLIEARILWWQAFHQKLDGFLYWGLNIWDRPENARPIRPEQGPLLDWSITSDLGNGTPLYGDGRLIYPGTNGPIGSIRLANIRDGLEDYEYLWLLAQRTGATETARQACLPVTDSLTHFTRDPAALYAQRDAIARQIAGTRR